MANQENSVNQANTGLTKKHDFVELDFSGKSEGEVFDTTIKEEAKKLNPDIKETKSAVICIGEEMLVAGFDKALEGKELGKKYKISLRPEEAYGKRNAQMIKLIPKKVFLAQKMQPIAGMTVALDNNLAKIISVSGGRVLVDFNNPLAGKDVEYEFIIKRKITDTKERVNALQNFFFRHEFPFELDEARKKIVFKDLQLAPILKVFRDKFVQFTGFDVEIFDKKEKKEEKTEKTQEIEEKH